MTKHPLSILITGATAGIGRHAAEHLAALGHHVIATGRNAPALAALAADAATRGHKLDVLRLDVTDAGSIAGAASAALRLTGGRGIDALVNNAGYGQPGTLADMADGELRRQFETNVFGLMATTRAFIPQLRARRGRIVNVSSVGGRVTFPLFGAYHASKYAVEALSDALRLELLPFGIRVALIEPGPIRSDFADRAVENLQSVASSSSPYASVYARAEEIRAITDRQSASPIVVSRAIARALTARRPRARTVVPFSSRIMVAAMRLLPSRVTDLVLTRLIGLTETRMRPEPPLLNPAG